MDIHARTRYRVWSSGNLSTVPGLGGQGERWGKIRPNIGSCSSCNDSTGATAMFYSSSTKLPISTSLSEFVFLPKKEILEEEDEVQKRHAGTRCFKFSVPFPSLQPPASTPPPLPRLDWSGLNPWRYIKLVVKSRHIAAEINKAVRDNLLRRNWYWDGTSKVHIGQIWWPNIKQWQKWSTY